jgi:hypothetical protein
MLPLKLDANGSVFVVLKQPATFKSVRKYKNWPSVLQVQTLKKSWKVQFDKAFGGPASAVLFDQLKDWSQDASPEIKYYSGTANYSQDFNWHKSRGQNSGLWLDLGRVDDIADVYVNGKFCGTAWTFPFRVNIGKALKNGRNEVKIAVSNTWANRLIGDHALPEDKRITWTNAVFRLEGKPLLPSGLLGPVKLVRLKY